jgi:predicted nucleic acid-binding protein
VYILDTNIIRYSVSEASQYPLLEANIKAKGLPNLWLSVITAQELIRWHFEAVEESVSLPRRQAMEAYFYFWDILRVIRMFQIAQFNEEAYDHYLGMPGEVDLADRRIAASALMMEFVVVTRNVKDFKAIQKVRPKLQFQNWVDEDHT